MNTRLLLPLTAIPFLIGAFGCVASNGVTAQSPNQVAQNSSQPNQQHMQTNHPGPNFAVAAQKLGISEAKLKAALGVPSSSQAAPNTPGLPPPLDVRGAATKLGITEEKLVNALGVPNGPPRPNLAAAAQKLGVSEAKLKAAMGVPSNPQVAPPQGPPPRPDLKAAAAKLGVTEQQLINALGLPRPQQ